MLLFGTRCQLQKSRLKFKISINLLAEPHCPCSRKGQWPWENTDIVQRHFGEKFPFHLKLIHTQTPGEGSSLTTLLVSPRAWQDPLFSPTSYKLKANTNFSHPKQNTIPLRKENKSLRFKSISSFQIFNKSLQFFCLINKTKVWVAKITYENRSMALPT